VPCGAKIRSADEFARVGPSDDRENENEGGHEVILYRRKGVDQSDE
jgi:hypothetical protein